MEHLFDQLKATTPINTVGSPSKNETQGQDDLSSNTNTHDNATSISAITDLIIDEIVGNPSPESSPNQSVPVDQLKETSRKRRHSSVNEAIDVKKIKNNPEIKSSHLETKGLSLGAAEYSHQKTFKKRKCVVRIRRMNLGKYIENQQKKSIGKRKTSPRKAKIASPKQTVTNESIFKIPSNSKRIMQKEQIIKTRRNEDTLVESELKKKYGSRFFLSYVKIKRYKDTKLSQNQLCKTKSDRNVSFSESVEILGSDGSNDATNCADITKNSPVTVEGIDSESAELSSSAENSDNVKFTFEKTLVFPVNESPVTVLDADDEMPSFEQSPSVSPKKDDETEKVSSGLLEQNQLNVEQLQDINVGVVGRESREASSSLLLPRTSTNYDAVDNSCITNGDVAMENNRTDVITLDDNSNSAIEKQTDSDISFSMQANNSNSSASFVSAEERPILNGNESILQDETSEVFEKTTNMSAGEAEAINGNVDLPQMNAEVLEHECSTDFRLHVDVSNTPMHSPASNVAEVNEKDIDNTKNTDVNPLRTVTCAVDDDLSMDLFGENSRSSCQYINLTNPEGVKKNVTEIIEDLAKDIGLDELHSDSTGTQQPEMSSNNAKKDLQI